MCFLHNQEEDTLSDAPGKGYRMYLCNVCICVNVFLTVHVGAGRQGSLNEEYKSQCWTRGLQSAVRVWGKNEAKKKGQKEREESEERKARQIIRVWAREGERSSERLRDCQRQSKNGREWACIAELRALQYIAVPSPRCVLCSPSGSMH